MARHLDTARRPEALATARPNVPSTTTKHGHTLEETHRLWSQLADGSEEST